jgi:hypothetical protein
MLTYRGAWERGGRYSSDKWDHWRPAGFSREMDDNLFVI